MNKHFIEGFEKVAEAGNTFKDTWKRGVKNTSDAEVGALIGAGIAGLTSQRKGIHALRAALEGAGLGALSGLALRGVKGTYDDEATKIHNRYAKDK